VAATRDDKQITIDLLSRVVPERFRAAVRVVTDLFTATVAAVVAWQSVRLVLFEREFPTTAFAEVPTWVCQLVLPVAFTVIAVRYLAFAAKHLRQALRGGGGP
jgi:TRAP-type C4-dicarboxylate transport system permease small subunit